MIGNHGTFLFFSGNASCFNETKHHWEILELESFFWGGAGEAFSWSTHRFVGNAEKVFPYVFMLLLLLELPQYPTVQNKNRVVYM